MRIAYNSDETIEVKYQVNDKDSSVSIIEIQAYVCDKYINITDKYTLIEKEVDAIIFDDLLRVDVSFEENMKIFGVKV